MGVLSIVSSRRSRASDSVAGGNSVSSKANGSIFGGSSRMSAKQRRSMAAMNASSSSIGGFILSPQAAAAARRAASVRADAAALAAAVRTDGATRATLCNLLVTNSKAAGSVESSLLGSPLDVEDFVRSSNGVEKCSGGVPALRRALQASRLDDPASFAGRYSLFVQWSPDGQHPWDSAAGAESPSATLELAILDDNTDADDGFLTTTKKTFSGRRQQVAAFLDGAAVEYEFADGVLRTKAPMPCAAPDGSIAQVHLQLQFSSGEPAWSTGNGKTAKHYAAPQCHGLFWFDATSGALPPADWPPAPPRVSGKANLTARPAARSPAGLPSLASFAGEFETMLLPAPVFDEAAGRLRRDGAPRKGLKLKISQDGKVVTLGAKQLKGVQFTRSSILSWKADAASSTPAGWVHCGHHASGPLLLGRLEESSSSSSSSSSPLFNFMAECAGSPSVFLTVDAIDTSAAALEAAGLASAATAEVEVALANAEVAWASSSSPAAEDETTTTTSETSSSSFPAVIEAARAAAVAAVRRALAADAERELLVRAFGAVADGPGLVAMPDEASLGAASAQEEAVEHARAARHAADVAEAAAAVAEAAKDAAEEDNNSSTAGQQRRRPAAAAAKSATAAFNASRASASAAQAEAAASRAAGHARRTRMAGSRYVAALAAASFNLAAAAARDATGAASDAAGAALSAARRHLAELALGEDYAAVRGAADAAEACSRARLLLAADATSAWAAGTARSRALAPALTSEAAEAAAEGARFLRELAAAASASEAAEGGETQVFVPTTAAVSAAAAASAAAKTEAAATAAAALAAAAANAAAVVEEEVEVVAEAEAEVAAAVVTAAEEEEIVAAAAPVVEDA